MDSVESSSPVWMLEVDDHTGCSLLGKGQHLKGLRNLELAATGQSPFLPEIRRWKDCILDCILGKNVSFWQPASECAAETRAILSDNFSLLNTRDRLALETRLQDFENPEKSGLRFNLRTGK